MEQISLIYDSAVFLCFQFSDPTFRQFLNEFLTFIRIDLS